MTLVEINPKLVKSILDGYTTDNWWAKVYKQVLNNEISGIDKVFLPFVLVSIKPSDSNS